MLYKGACTRNKFFNPVFQAIGLTALNTWAEALGLGVGLKLRKARFPHMCVYDKPAAREPGFAGLKITLGTDLGPEVYYLLPHTPGKDLAKWLLVATTSRG